LQEIKKYSTIAYFKQGGTAKIFQNIQTVFLKTINISDNGDRYGEALEIRNLFHRRQAEMLKQRI